MSAPDGPHDGPMNLAIRVGSDKKIPYRFIQPMVRTTAFGINSFRYEGPKIRNNLPEYLKDANEVGEFKQLIQQWSGPKCQCENCILCNVKNV